MSFDIALSPILIAEEQSAGSFFSGRQGKSRINEESPPEQCLSRINSTDLWPDLLPPLWRWRVQIRHGRRVRAYSTSTMCFSFLETLGRTQYSKDVFAGTRGQHGASDGSWWSWGQVCGLLTFTCRLAGEVLDPCNDITQCWLLLGYLGHFTLAGALHLAMTGKRVARTR